MAAKKKEIRKAAPARRGGAASRRSSASTCPRRARRRRSSAARRPKPRRSSCAGSATKRGCIAVILVIAEQRDGKLNRATWETDRRRAAAGRHRLERRSPCWCPGTGASGVAAELAAAQVKEVVTVEHAALEPYTPDGYTAALQDAIASALADLRAAAAHLPDARLRAEAGGAPRPRARHRRHRPSRRAGGETAFVRPMFQGKLTADVVPSGPGAALRHVPDRRVSRRPGREGVVARRRSARSTVNVDAVGDPPEAGAAVPAGEAGGRSVAGRAHRLGRPRHQGAGEHRARAEAGRGARRRDRRVASDLRRRLAADGAPGRQLGADGGAEAVRRARHLRRDSASGRHEGLEHDRRDQQGSRRADLRDRRLRHRRRPVRDRAGDHRA